MQIRSKAVPVLLAILTLSAAAAGAVETYSAPLLLAGEDERVDGDGTCPREDAFVAGTASTAPSLNVGGNAWGCDSEWGVAAEFDLTAFLGGPAVLAAEFVVRKTGHEEGLPYVAVYGYSADGTPVLLPRDDLDEFSALDIRAPGVANVDLVFSVTGAVQDLLDDGATRAGFFLCGVFSEVGRMDRIYVGGTSHAFPPRLILTVEGTVAVERSTWGGIKSIYR